MKKLLLLLLTLAALNADAQPQKRYQVQTAQSGFLQPAPYNKTFILPETSTPEVTAPHPLHHSGANYRDMEETIALTTWDAQAYGSMPSRHVVDPEGKPAAAWIYATDLNGAYPERGTGYSTKENGSWSPSNARIETVRTGFPAMAQDADGVQYVVAHYTGVNPFQLILLSKAPGAPNWTETLLPNPPGSGCLWPRIAIGGPDGKTIHIIGITTPTANGGVTYQGVDAHILYWRSNDGGQSWEKSASIIPGLDQSKFARFTSDSYAIDVNGDVVGVAVFPDWNDLMVFKSFDNGDTWESATVNDFPDGVENYAGAQGDSYTYNDIGFFDPNAPDSLAVFSSDGFGALLIDDAGQAHVWFGAMYYIDNDPAEGAFYYPGWNGLIYWKESFGQNNLLELTGALDYDGDTALAVTSIAEIGTYYNSLSSFPTVGVDENGAIYLAYAALHELYRSDWSPIDKFYRHIYIMKSEDYGDTWGDPYDITTETYIDPFLLPFTEAVYPALARHISDCVSLIYQQDALPGTNVWGDHHTSSENGIVYVCVERDSVPTLTYNAYQEINLEIFPNPATDHITIRAESSGGANEAGVALFNAFGQQVRHWVFPAGQQIQAPLNGIPAGVYWLQYQQDRKIGLKKIIKQ